MSAARTAPAAAAPKSACRTSNTPPACRHVPRNAGFAAQNTTRPAPVFRTAVQTLATGCSKVTTPPAATSMTSSAPTNVTGAWKVAATSGPTFRRVASVCASAKVVVSETDISAGPPSVTVQTTVVTPPSVRCENA